MGKISQIDSEVNEYMTDYETSLPAVQDRMKGKAFEEKLKWSTICEKLLK